LKEMTFPMAMRDFFGTKAPGEKASDFIKEIKDLTMEDRAFFAGELEKNSYKITSK
jgi:hypothetical protein